jgi:hypothetical protein
MSPQPSRTAPDCDRGKRRNQPKLSISIAARIEFDTCGFGRWAHVRPIDGPVRAGTGGPPCGLFPVSNLRFQAGELPRLVTA